MPRGKRHYRIRLDDALEAHEMALKYGGAPGVLNVSLVEAAIGRPYIGYNRTIASKCAALMESMCRNHGFVDGNKRTAVLLVDLLLDRSGYDLGPIHGEDLNDAIEQLAVDAATGASGFAFIENWFSLRLQRRTPQSDE